MTLNEIKQITPEGVELNNTIEKVIENIPITLSISSEVMKYLKTEFLDINGLFILIALYEENISILDMYDESNTRVDILKFQYQDLYIHGFIEDGDNTIYQITQKGKEFVEKITSLFEIKVGEVLESEEEFKKLCENYLEIFPKTKLPSGKYARVSIVEIEKKMRTFLKVYRTSFKRSYGFKLTFDDILKATLAYVNRYSKTGYLYMVTSSYFIQKNEKSGLADEIIAMKQGLDSSKSNFVTM